MSKALLISISSDIATALAKELLNEGYDLIGTSRNPHFSLIPSDKLVSCDLKDRTSTKEAAQKLIPLCQNWDLIICSAGALEPIGKFSDVDFDEWQESLEINFVNQLRIVHSLLPHRNLTSLLPQPTVLFFAGGGTNNAPTHYSSYILSKIALTKMCELLAAELPDIRFLIIGPGWVETKIHATTFAAGVKAGPHLSKAEQVFKDKIFVSMEEVVKCCLHLIKTPCNAVSGRNFSVQYDSWSDEELGDALLASPNMYKLRRSGNEWKASLMRPITNII